MSTYGPDKTGLKVWIYVDDTDSYIRSGHSGSYRIKYQQDPNISNTRKWMPITIPGLEIMDKENIPPRKVKQKIENEVIEWARLNLQLLMDLRDKKIDKITFKNNMRKIGEEKIIFDSEINNK